MTDRDFYRRRLPHWHPPHATFFVTFRLEGSLPKAFVETLQKEYERARQRLYSIPASQQTQEAYDLYRKAYVRLERVLDKAEGPRWLARPQLADIVQKEIHALHPQYYHLHAFCLMPNHVHLLVDTQDIPAPPARKKNISFTALTYALWLLKGRTGHACQKLLGQSGRFWGRESYDHVVRSNDEFQRILFYIVNNPVKAGLVDRWQDWPYTFVAQSYRDLL